MPLIKPRLLKAGDTVGILTPSSPTFEPGVLKFTLDRLGKLGLNWRFGAAVGQTYSSYAGSDQARASDLNDFFADETIDAVMPLRGGAGAPRLLPLLDFEKIKSNAKIICGFSDITALLIAIHQKTGLITFHGPTLNQMYETAFTYEYYLRALMLPEPVGVIGSPDDSNQEDGEDADKWGNHYPARMVIARGEAQGRLTGGCLTLIRNLMGTEWEIDCKDRILFFEDIDEEPHTMDRMLTQLMLAGKIAEARGIVIGDCSGCKPGGSKRNVLTLNYSLETMLRERLGGLNIPVVYGVKLGHTADKVTLPLGAMASLSASESGIRFSIDESGCT
jgi:muramoyltetrapeptide carboxypeptidase